MARVRARRACARGWDGKDGSRSIGLSRTRPPARRLWSLASRFGASRPLRDDPAGFGALSASARTRLLAGTGEAAARMPGGAPMFRAGDRKAEDPETPPCEDGLGAASTATGSSPAEATAAIADPCGSAPRADAAPLSNASGSAPSRTGWANTRMKFHRLLRNLFKGQDPAHWRGCILSAKLRRGDQPGGGS